jgi:hypothetical protein
MGDDEVPMDLDLDIIKDNLVSILEARFFLIKQIKNPMIDLYAHNIQCSINEDYPATVIEYLIKRNICLIINLSVLISNKMLCIRIYYVSE